MVNMALSKTSAEPARTAAYSSDIGWRVVWQRAGMGLSFRDIATRLQIGLGTARRIYKKFEETGEVAPIKAGPRPNLHKLDEIHELYILGLLVENSGLYLRITTIYLHCYWYKCFWVNSVQSATEKWINQKENCPHC